MLSVIFYIFIVVNECMTIIVYPAIINLVQIYHNYSHMTNISSALAFIK